MDALKYKYSSGKSHKNLKNIKLFIFLSLILDYNPTNLLTSYILIMFL